MEPTYYYKQGLSFIKATEESLHLINKENESLKAENARFREAIDSIRTLTFCFVMNKDTASEILSIVKPIREKCSKILELKNET